LKVITENVQGDVHSVTKKVTKVLSTYDEQTSIISLIDNVAVLVTATW
jgi:hypothetical protein